MKQIFQHTIKWQKPTNSVAGCRFSSSSKKMTGGGKL